MATLGQGILEGKKTYILAALGALTAIAGYLTGSIDLPTLVQALFNAAGAFTIRKAIK